MNSKLICANGQAGENQGQANPHSHSVLSPPRQSKWHSANSALVSFISKTKFFYSWLVGADFLEEAGAPTFHCKDGFLLCPYLGASFAYVSQIRVGSRNSRRGIKGQCANFISLPTVISSGMCTLLKCSFYKVGKQNCFYDNIC